jgi:hypothetical protein
MPGSPAHAAVEVFKFGVYMFFPVWIMFNFGDPQWWVPRGPQGPRMVRLGDADGRYQDYVLPVRYKEFRCAMHD